jgi:hypothetical protein
MNRMNREELMDWAADNYTVAENSEGTPDEALMAGWVFAMDEQDARKGLSDAEFIKLAYSQFDNMGY